MLTLCLVLCVLLSIDCINAFLRPVIHRQVAHINTIQVKNSLIVINDKNNNDVDTEEKGIETKYLYAIGVVIFGVLWDFFITHHGQVYLH